MALTRLRAVHGSFWDSGWRREHRGSGRYPEHHLWEAVQGYLGFKGEKWPHLRMSWSQPSPKS